MLAARSFLLEIRALGKIEAAVFNCSIEDDLVLPLLVRTPIKQLSPHLLERYGHTPVISPALWGSTFQARFCSSAAAVPSVNAEDDVAKKETGVSPPTEKKELASYWGVSPKKIVKPDGTEWKWSCFRPWDAYKPDLSIDLKKHHVPTNFLDKMAFYLVKSLRLPTDIFFQGGTIYHMRTT